MNKNNSDLDTQKKETLRYLISFILLDIASFAALGPGFWVVLFTALSLGAAWYFITLPKRFSESNTEENANAAPKEAKEESGIILNTFSTYEVDGDELYGMYAKFNEYDVLIDLREDSLLEDRKSFALKIAANAGLISERYDSLFSEAGGKIDTIGIYDKSDPTCAELYCTAPNGDNQTYLLNSSMEILEI